MQTRAHTPRNTHRATHVRRRTGAHAVHGSDAHRLMCPSPSPADGAERTEHVSWTPQLLPVAPPGRRATRSH
eukprot:2168366-Prymnesium_polylepis.1